MPLRSLSLILLIAASLHAAANSNSARPLPGLEIGARAPAFSLPSATGGSVDLSELLSRGSVALAFVRSTDWCPYCRRQLQDLEKNLAQLKTAGVQLVAISYDAPVTNAGAAKKLGLTFPLLSDAGSKVIDAYGIRNREARGRSEGIPHPVLFLVDSQGVIRAKLGRDGYRDRPETAEILAAAKSLR
jgi:peroxiredoxin